MTITVLVPSEEGMRALAADPRLTPLIYDTTQALDERQRAAQVLVPGFLAADDRAGMLSGLPNLRLVQLLTAGAEVWLGKLPQGVQLSLCRGAHGGSTAEWVMAVLLSMHRELDGFAQDQRKSHWNQHTTDTVQGKSVLVLGAGDLGRALQRRLLAFDAVVTLVGTRARDDVRALADLPTLLPVHDIVVLMVPLTSATTGMVDAEFLAAMADGAILVNAARGPVVNTDALLGELTSRRLRAALDVTDPEPLPADHPLWTAPNVVITPHVGGSVRGLNERAWAIAAAEIERFAAGEPLRHLVDGEY